MSVFMSWLLAFRRQKTDYEQTVLITKLTNQYYEHARCLPNRFELLRS